MSRPKYEDGRCRDALDARSLGDRRKRHDRAWWYEERTGLSVFCMTGEHFFLPLADLKRAIARIEAARTSPHPAKGE